jgi:hypothetical protein
MGKGRDLMRTIGKAAAGLVVALATIGSTCDDTNNRVTGTYQLTVVESRDSCDQEFNSFGSVVTVTSGSAGAYTVSFGDAAVLEGSFSDEGVLVAQGVIDDQGDGKTTTMQIGILVRQGLVEGTGRLTYNGTFPGVTGSCVQEFSFTGQRTDSRAPVVG